MGQLVRVTEPNPAGRDVEHGLRLYNTLGKLKTVTMVRPSGTQTRTFNYNTLGQLTSAVNPENGTVTYTYNSDGTMATKIDAKNQKMVYGYDSFLRLTSIARHATAGGAADPNQSTTMTYDTPAGGGYLNPNGRLTQVKQMVLDEGG
jgi:YD repeat-containing protein